MAQPGFQETLADKVAAVCYGAQSFETGLIHVIRRGIEFQEAASFEINNAVRSRRPLQNLYKLEAVESRLTAGKVRDELSKPTSPDDTHPSPHDRFNYVRRIRSTPAPPLEGDVWELFRDPEAITVEMSRMAGASVGV